MRTGQGGLFLRVKFRSKGNFLASTKLEATLGDRIDLRMSGQPEEPHLMNERQAKVFLMSSLMKQVLESPNKSTMRNDLSKNYSQKNADKVDYYPAPNRDSETRAPQNCNLERHEVSKIADRVRCQFCFTYQRPRDNFFSCGSTLQGITEEVKKQAEQRISSRFIMYVFGFHNLPLKNTQRGRRYGNSAESHINSRKQEITWISQRNTITERSWSASREKAVPHAHEQGYTQSDMEEFDWISNAQRIYVASSTERAHHRDQYKVVQPSQ